MNIPFKRTSAAAFGALVMATITGGLAQPAIVHAERVWDIAVYDQCLKDNYGEQSAHFRCGKSGGQWDYDNKKCTAPPARIAADVMPHAPVGVLDQGTPQNPGPQVRPSVVLAPGALQGARL